MGRGPTRQALYFIWSHPFGRTHHTLPLPPSPSQHSGASGASPLLTPVSMSVFCSTLRSTSASAPQWRRCRRGPAPAATPRLVAAASAVLSAPKARFRVKRSESVSVQQRQRPLAEYMSLPASQYSVLDAERIERVDENTFRCYVYRLKFFSFEVCPVLLVRVEVEPYGCCIRLVSCKLEGSPIVVAQNEKFTASMENKISYNNNVGSSGMQQLSTDTTIEVTVDIPFPFRALPLEAIESTGTQVLEQLLRAMLPRFLSQLVKDYEAWASGNTSRQPLSTGKI